MMAINSPHLRDLARPLRDLCATYGNESKKLRDYYPPMYIGGSRAADMSIPLQGEKCATQKEAIR